MLDIYITSHYHHALCSPRQRLSRAKNALNKGFWFRGWWVGVVDFLVFTFPLHPIQNFDLTHWHISLSRYQLSITHSLITL